MANLISLQANGKVGEFGQKWPILFKIAYTEKCRIRFLQKSAKKGWRYAISEHFMPN